MANKISVVLDVVTDKAVSGLKGFKNAVGDADGAVGKFKAGAGSAFDSIKGQAGNLAMVAGAAIVTFGVKAVGAFTDAALAAGKLADATGLSTEEASKWVAVADDIGISSESMEKSFGKLAQSIGKNNPLLEEYGITVKKGADGQDDMNATMLHAIDVIRGIQDPTKKAAVAQAALGKGWMEMAELIEQGSGSLTESMAAVSEAQVIDPKEVEKARKMRESMDNLQDSIRDVALVMGEDLVPMAVAAADALTTIIGPLSDVNQWTKDVSLGFLELVGVIEKLPGDTANAGKGIGQMASQLDEASGAGHMHIEMQEGLKAATEASTEATEGSTKSATDFEKALQGLNDAMDDRIEATNKLVGGDIAVRDSQREAAAAVAELTAAQLEGKLSTDELAAAQDGAAESLIGAAEAAAAYDEQMLAASGQALTATEKQDLLKAKLSEVASTLAPGSPLRVQLQGYIDLLNQIPAAKTTVISTDSRGLKFNARGTSHFSGGATIVGEEGPELVELPTGSAIHSASDTRNMLSNGSGHGSGGGGGLTVNINGGLIDQRTIEQLAREWDRWKRGLS